jgi:hypothetical protein
MILTDPIPPWVPHWTSGAIIITAPAITWGPASAFIVIIMSRLALSSANLPRPVTLVIKRRLLVAFVPTLGWAAGIVVRIWDLRRMIVPLTYFIEKPSQNWTDKNTDPLGSVIFHVDYTVPVERLRRKLERSSTKASCGTKVAVLQVTDTPESMVELRASVSAHNASPPGICGARCGKS